MNKFNFSKINKIKKKKIWQTIKQYIVEDTIKENKKK